VLEAAPVPGGVIGTSRRDGALYERGPNSTLDTSPKVGALLRDAGLDGERMNASEDAAIRYIVRDGKLVALPTSPPKFFTTPAFSLGAKLALFREPFVPPTPTSSSDTTAPIPPGPAAPTEEVYFAVHPGPTSLRQPTAPSFGGHLRWQRFG
jgi:oxygen-dependent protoporphyrinogen oxidase